MKKALAFFMVLAIATGVAFAADAPKTFGDESTVAVSGFGKLSWATNLNTDGTSGFNNETEWAVKIPLLTKQTFTKTGEGSYAEISIVDAQYNINGAQDNTAFGGGDKKIDSVKAKLVFGNVYVTIYDKPGFKTDNAQIWEPIKKDGYRDDGKEYKTLLKFEPGFDAWGTKIGYKAEKFDFGVKIGSKQHAGVNAADNKSYYAVGADLTVTPSDMITASFTANNAMWDGTTADSKGKFASSIISLGGKVVAKPVTDLVATVAFDAGNDYVINEKGDTGFAYEASVDAAYKFVTLGGFYSSAGTTELSGVDKDFKPIGDMSVFAKLVGDSFVPNLTASATVIAHHLLTSPKGLQDAFDAGVVPPGIDKATAALAFGVNLAYKYAMGDVNYVKPYVNYYGQNMTVLDVAAPVTKKGSDMVSAYELGLDYGLFSNAVINVNYAAGSTNDNHAFALIKTTAANAANSDLNDKGTFTVSCKVTY